jgi:hypothetical protein
VKRWVRPAVQHAANPVGFAARVYCADPMFITDDPQLLPPLWQRVQSMLVRATEAIGRPSAIAALGPVAPILLRRIACWVSLLESVIRKLLLAEAGHLIQAQPGAGWRLQARASLKCNTCGTSQAARATPAIRAFDPIRPETWSARFALAPPRDPRATPESSAPRIRALWGPTPPPPARPPRRPPHHAPAAERLALRFEALRRVLDDPTPYAERLARLLSRLSRRYPEVAHRFAIAPARPHFTDLVDARLIVEAIAVALTWAPRFANTS